MATYIQQISRYPAIGKGPELRALLEEWARTAPSRGFAHNLISQLGSEGRNPARESGCLPDLSGAQPGKSWPWALHRQDAAAPGPAPSVGVVSGADSPAQPSPEPQFQVPGQPLPRHRKRPSAPGASRGTGQGNAGARVSQPLTPDVWQRGTGLRDKHRVPGHGLPGGLSGQQPARPRVPGLR